MQTDLKLHGYRFNIALMVFYAGYFIVEIPSNILLKMVGARYYLPGMVVSFGLVSMCTACKSNHQKNRPRLSPFPRQMVLTQVPVVQSYHGLLAARFFLGITEGGLMPGIAYYLACFFRKNELLLRIGLFINGASLAGGFGGLLAAGLTQIPRWGAAGMPIHTWRNIFFFEGLLTIVVGIGAMFITPSTPLDCKFLSDRDRYIAAERINKEQNESNTKKVTKKDVLRGMFNIHTVICGFCFMVF